MPEYNKILENLEKAERCVRSAEESLVPIFKVKQVDAYILGLLRTIRLVMDDTKKAAKAANRAQSGLPPKHITSRLK